MPHFAGTSINVARDDGEDGLYGGGLLPPQCFAVGVIRRLD